MLWNSYKLKQLLKTICKKSKITYQKFFRCIFLFFFQDVICDFGVGSNDERTGRAAHAPMWHYHSTSTSSRTYPSCPWNHKQDGCVLETGWPQVNEFTSHIWLFHLPLPPFSLSNLEFLEMCSSMHGLPKHSFHDLSSTDTNTAQLKLPARSY